MLVIVASSMRTAVRCEQGYDNTARVENFQLTRIELDNELLLAQQILVLAHMIDTTTAPLILT